MKSNQFAGGRDDSFGATILKDYGTVDALSLIRITTVPMDCRELSCHILKGSYELHRTLMSCSQGFMWTAENCRVMITRVLMDCRELS